MTINKNDPYTAGEPADQDWRWEEEVGRARRAQQTRRPRRVQQGPRQLPGAEEADGLGTVEFEEESDDLVMMDLAEEPDGLITTEPAEEVNGLGAAEPAEDLDGLITTEPAEEVNGLGAAEPATEPDGLAPPELAEETDDLVTAEPSEEPAAPQQSLRLPPRKWFFTFMCMNIPIVGWIYLLSKAYSKKENQLKDFCRAYLLYKLVFLVISLIILGVLVYVGLEIADKVLAYMEML